MATGAAPPLLTSLAPPHCQTRRGSPDTATSAPFARPTRLGNRRAMITTGPSSWRRRDPLTQGIRGPRKGVQGGPWHATCQSCNLLGQAEGSWSRPARGSTRARHVLAVQPARASRGQLVAACPGAALACHVSFAWRARGSPRARHVHLARSARGSPGHATCPGGSQASLCPGPA